MSVLGRRGGVVIVVVVDTVDVFVNTAFPLLQTSRSHLSCAGAGWCGRYGQSFVHDLPPGQVPSTVSFSLPLALTFAFSQCVPYVVHVSVVHTTVQLWLFHVLLWLSAPNDDRVWCAVSSTDKLPYVTMGSGSLAAMAVFEAGYKDDMTVRLPGNDWSWDCSFSQLLLCSRLLGCCCCCCCWI